MRRASIRELHLRTGAIVDEAAEGHTVVILKRGVPVAELRSITSKGRVRGLPDRSSWLAKFPQVKGDSGRFLEEDRS